MQVHEYPPLEIIKFPTEGEENLALGETTKNFIRDEVTAQLDQSIDKFNPHGIRRVSRFLREWGLAGTLITAPIALLALAGAGWYYAFTRVAKEATFETATEDRLGTIDGDLKAIRNDLTKQSIVYGASLPLPQFKATLPELTTAVATAQQNKITVPAGVISDLQQKLLSSSKAPKFWPAAAQFINYRSQVSTPDFQKLLTPNLPNCADMPMHFATSGREITKEDLGHPVFVPINPGYYENCRFTLDSLEEAQKMVNHGAFLAVLFKNCQIVYRGGNVALLTAKWIGHPGFLELQFENCAFLFSLESAPSKDAQFLTRNLLEQSGPNFTSKLATHS